MPHRVVDFFLSPNDSIHTLKQSVQRHASPVARKTRSKERGQAPRTNSYGSTGTVEDHIIAPPIRMWGSSSAKDKQKEQREHKEHHRLSFPGLHLVGHKTQKDLSQNSSASLDWKIESAPAVLHGTPDQSSGALVSGQLLLGVKEDAFEVDGLEAKLEIHITHKKPYHNHCHDCANQTQEVKSWSFLSEPTVLQQRTHEFPFSVLLDGHLPATTDTSLLSIQYVFTAEARLRDGGHPLKMVRTMDVRRSLRVPELPHHSLRIFPPTNITASVHYDSVVHPNAESAFTLRLNGIGKHNQTAHSVEYWKLKRLSWKLEENVTTVAPACHRHVPKDSSPTPTGSADDAEAKKGIARTDSRIIAHGDMHSGWKADYYSADGNIQAEIAYLVGGSSSRPISCDMRRSDGTSINHKLVVEMVVAQEYAPLGQTRHVTPTGIARILRMNFGVVVTDRAGLGVSWDNEAPPIYQDVPPSPPSYALATIHGSVEDLTLSPTAGSGRTTPVDGEESPAYSEVEGPSSPTAGPSTSAI